MSTFIHMKEKVYSFNRQEKLKSRKQIREVFETGKSFSHFPFRVLYLQVNENPSNLQAAFSVSTKHFKLAVDRNRIRRLMREAYRLQKQPLLTELQNKQIHCVIFFIYTGSQLPKFYDIKSGIGGVLERVLEKALNGEI
ncbi:ribonuclease P protein component [soil metagenome]